MPTPFLHCYHGQTPASPDSPLPAGLDTLQHPGDSPTPSWAPHHGPALGCVPSSSGASCSWGQKSRVLYSSSSRLWLSPCSRSAMFS